MKEREYLELIFSNGKRIFVERNRDGVIIGRDPSSSYMMVQKIRKDCLLETVYLPHRDQYISRIAPSEGKLGSIHITYCKENVNIYVPLSAKNPVQITCVPTDRRYILCPGEVLQLREDPLRILVGESKVSLRRTKIKPKLFIYEPELLKKMENLYVVGDLHGDLKTLEEILKHVDLQKDGIIFLGDYADRGPNGIEVIRKINELLEKYPDRVVTLKGNHEDFTEDGCPTFRPCNLIDEANQKIRGGWGYYFKNELKPFLDRLYIAAIIPGKILFVHGGISSKVNSLDDLINPNRDLEMDILWSDPIDGNGEYLNEGRGVGVLFGRDITENVCRRLGIKAIIRGHEPEKVMWGPAKDHDGKVLTVLSTSVYGHQPHILKIELGLPKIRIISYEIRP